MNATPGGLVAGPATAARDRPGSDRSFSDLLWGVGLPFVVTRLVLGAITLTAPLWRFTVPDPGRFLSPTRPIGGALLGRWFNWDAAWYLRIAGFGPQMGYSRYAEGAGHHFSAFAFFPLYPLLVRLVAWVVPGAHHAVPAGGAIQPALLAIALVVSNVVFVLALAALFVLVRARAGSGAARRAVWLLCLFPTTIFFSAPYSEGLFLLWLVLFFIALDRRRWWLAGVAGALAAATRSLGVGLVVPYVVCALASRQWAVGNGQWAAGSPSPAVRERGPGGEGRLLPVVLIPLGLVAFMAYLVVAWGDPLLFQKAEQAWNRSLAAPWVGIVDGLSWSLRGWPHLPQQNWRGLTDALYAVVFLGLTALAWRDLDWVERSYCIVFWLYALCTPQIDDPRYPDTLISTARFLLVLLPLWTWLARSRWRTSIFLVPSILVFLIYAARWVNHAWIA